mmetsp:Transcript_22817/g.25146  ORF Transcript_22817/g.25146 Transcript_22817/m.25146 type:complete len:189 (+) Transcript_22817:39-605(+)
MWSYTLQLIVVTLLSGYGKAFMVDLSTTARSLATTTNNNRRRGPQQQQWHRRRTSDATTTTSTTIKSAVDISSSLAIESSNFFQLISTASDLSFGNTDVIVFVIGIIPFGWATVSFWRRIAVGEPFGTGKDSVFIGKDDSPSESRGRRTLDKGAFFIAYILFGIAAGIIALTLYSVISTSPPPPETFQ